MKNKKTGWIVPAALIALGILGIALGAGKALEIHRVRSTKLVVWDAPSSMRTGTEEDMSTNTELVRPMDLVLSPLVTLSVNEKKVPVYETNVSHSHVDSASTPLQSRTPVAIFDFDGVVRVELKPGFVPESAEVLPSAAGILPEIREDTVSFTLDGPGNYTVVFNGAEERAMHLFTRLPEKDVPDPEDESVLYFAPGEYDAGTVDLKSGQTLYLAGGAVLHGNIRADHTENVKIRGRGIVDGSRYGGDASNRVVRIPVDLEESKNVTVEGITLLNSNGWVIQGYSSESVTVDGVAIVSSRANGDGITLQSCRDFLVKNSFVRTWDDSLVVKNYAGNTDNLTFEDNQIWTDLAQSMEIGYETNKGYRENAVIENITFRRNTVLYNLHKPVISIHNGDSCDVRHIVYEDTVVEHADMAFSNHLVEIQILESGWSTTYERGTVEDVTVSGLRVLASSHDKLAASISGFGRTYFVKDVIFSGLDVLGNTGGEALDFKIDSKNTEHIAVRKEASK